MRGVLSLLAGVLAWVAVLNYPAHTAEATATPAAVHRVQVARQNQGDPNATYWPVVDNPVGHRYGTGHVTYLAVDAPHDAWGHALRRFGAYVNGQHLGVVVLVHHTCSEAPSDPCVVLRESSKCSGCGAETSGTAMRRVVNVSTSWTSDTGYAYPFMAHEFGHVLGLEHHDQHGVDGAWPNEVTFSSAERQALVAMYVWKH